MPPLLRRAWIEVAVDRITANLAAARAIAGAGVLVAPVLKADAYGHGLAGVLDALKLDATVLCVATLDEAFNARTHAPLARIVVLNPAPGRAAVAAAEANIELTMTDGGVRDLLATWPSRPAPAATLRVHLAIETGLHRGWIDPSNAWRIAQGLADLPGITVEGMWTHLAAPEDRAFTRTQTARFRAALARLRRAAIVVPIRHVAASGGLLAGTAPRYDMIRLGLALFGEVAPAVAAAAGSARVRPFRPAMTVKARPIDIADVPAGASVGYAGRWVAPRRSRLATLPIGYADGWLRGHEPVTEVLVRGRRALLAGTVAMDATVVDVTDVPGVGYEDEFVLLGEQGADRLTVGDVADMRGTLSWVVFGTLTPRLARVFTAAGAPIGLQALDRRYVRAADGPGDAERR